LEVSLSSVMEHSQGLSGCVALIAFILAERHDRGEIARSRHGYEVIGRLLFAGDVAQLAIALLMHKYRVSA